MAIAIGLGSMLNTADLPRMRPGVTCHYEGSIDKRGGNADWDWWLYQDERGEWVLFDDEGPGCVYNFVQHRYPTSEVPAFRFYFDGESEPRFTIKPEEFGKKHPFVEPLAAIFEGDDVPPRGRGPIWVVRSFVPMPYRKSCRITSTIKLEGNKRAEGKGGWGHVMFHRYPTADGVTTFTPEDDCTALLDVWSRCGEDPKPRDGNVVNDVDVTVAPGDDQIVAVYDGTGPGSIAAVKLSIADYDASMLRDLWIRMTWEDEPHPAVAAPVGAFFGNELGTHDIRTLMQGTSTSGSSYIQSPSARMPLRPYP